MSIIASRLSSMHAIFDEIATLIAPITLPILSAPKEVTLSGKADDGRRLRELISLVRNDVDAIINRPDIRSEAYGLSGTKNEILRDRFHDMSTLLVSIEGAVHEYLEELIASFAGKDVAQQEVNEMLRGGNLVEDGVIDDVSLHKLRVFTHNNPQADYRSFVAMEMARLGGHDEEKVVNPINQYGLVQRSILDGFRVLDPKDPKDPRDQKGLKGYDAVSSHILSTQKNTIIIHLPNYGREYFRPIQPAPGDVTKAIDVDFINRMTSIVSVPPVGMGDDVRHVLHLPHRGKLTSVYVTYDYETFFFMTPSFDSALTPYALAVGYYSAVTGLAIDDTPSPSHATYNDRANSIFADRWYRHDLVVLATSFKPGAGLSDALKSQIRDGFLRRIKDVDAKNIVPREVIYEAIHRVLPDGSRESRISSYLAADRLVFIFTKEYENEVGKVEWSTHQEVTMMGVISEVMKKCDKMNVWGIDFKSLKDLF